MDALIFFVAGVLAGAGAVLLFRRAPRAPAVPPARENVVDIRRLGGGPR